MGRRGVKKRAWLVVFLVFVGLIAGLAAKAGSFLIVDEPRRSDMILVLAGETDRRPARALELLASGYGRRVVDVYKRQALRVSTTNCASPTIFL